jgi:hypothetical protein
MLPLVSAGADLSGLRVAAIIISENGSRALIEVKGGEQNWYREGEQVADATITAITAHEISLESPEGSYRLPLRGNPVLVTDRATEEEVAPARHQAREFQFLSLLSEINSVDPRPGESYEDATARTLNEALGLGTNARITAVGRVEVASADEARRELQRHLGSAESPVRLTLENDYLEDMYVMPQ